MKNFFKNIWYSEFFISEDKKLINRILKAIVNGKNPDRFIQENKIQEYPRVNKDFWFDILRYHGKFFHIYKKNDNEYVRLTYYGYKFHKKGGYCIKYYVMQFLTLKFIFNKAKSYITL